LDCSIILFRAYNTLGVPQTASDDLVVEAYKNQIRTTDRKSHPYYLEFLGVIGRERNSEIIQTEHAMEKSTGRFDITDLSRAYKSIGLEWEKDQSYDDDYIIGMFNSRLMDMGLHEQDLRQELRIIGEGRGSRKICDVAENSKSS
jgi:A repeated domain in UCH-protein